MRLKFVILTVVSTEICDILVYMGRDHFSKTFHSPYFQSNYYKEETPGGKFETKVENWLKKVFFRPRKDTK
jgi:hypothetical protein